jgi:hypothetical protein
MSYWTKLGDVRVHVACREPRSAETQRALDELVAAASRRLKSGRLASVGDADSLPGREG